MAKVTLRGIEKAFGTAVVLRDVSLEIDEGELVSLLGPSGCGKTTLLRILAGFEAPDRGVINVDGEEITDLPPARRNMGMVFQAYSLFPNMTAEQNVVFGLRVRGSSPDQRARRAGELLEMVGLTQHREKYPRQLSGGQQQRVALARALAVAPQVLLLDEPLSALDAKVRVQLREEIRRIQQETKVTTIFVTHDQEEALSISDRVVVMQQGVLSQVGTPAAIYGEPDNMFVARFVGAVAELPAEVVDGAQGIVDLFGHRMRTTRAQGMATGAPIYFLLRPETVRVGPRGANGGLEGRVAGRTFFGALTSLRIELAGGHASVTAAMPSGEASQLAPGEQVSVSWAEDAPRILPRE